MPLIANAACNVDLSVRLVSPLLGDISLIYSHITQLTAIGRSQTNTHPIPASTNITDHMMHDPVEISIRGIIGCVGCSQASDSTQIITTLESSRRGTVYTPNDFFTITTNRLGNYRNMILVDYSADITDLELQTTTISTTWRASNLAGRITDPIYSIGGLT